MSVFGIVLNFVGTVLLAVSSVKGIAGMVVQPDWGASPIKWRSAWWRRAFVGGWLTLAAGFGLALIPGTAPLGPAAAREAQSAWLLYPILVSVLIFIGCVLWRSGNPPGVGYVAFVSCAAALIFVMAMDTGWYLRVPPFRAGGQTYAFERSTDARLGQIEERLGIPTPTPVPPNLYGAAQFGVGQFGYHPLAQENIGPTSTPTQVP